MLPLICPTQNPLTNRLIYWNSTLPSLGRICASVLDNAEMRPSRSSASPSADFLPASGMRSLLREGRRHADARLAAADMISVNEAASLLGERSSEVRRWVAAGHCIGLRDGRSAMRLPRWQFEGDMLLWMGPIARALGPGNGWNVLFFLETPHGGLGGRTPRQAIEHGDVGLVLSLASV